MYKYIKSSNDTSIISKLKSLNWEQGETEGIVAKATDGNTFYAVVVEWFDRVTPDLPPYCAYVVAADKEDVMEEIAWNRDCEIEDLADELGIDYDYFHEDFEYFVVDDTVDGHVVHDIGWYGTEDEAFDAAEAFIGW